MKKLFLSLLTIMMAVAMNAQTKATKVYIADKQQCIVTLPPPTHTRKLI